MRSLKRDVALVFSGAGLFLGILAVVRLAITMPSPPSVSTWLMIFTAAILVFGSYRLSEDLGLKTARPGDNRTRPEEAPADNHGNTN